jgi:hypothetical protein
VAATKGKCGDLNKLRTLLKCDLLEIIRRITSPDVREEEGLKNFDRTRDTNGF